MTRRSAEADEREYLALIGRITEADAERGAIIKGMAMSDERIGADDPLLAEWDAADARYETAKQGLRMWLAHDQRR